ncbi:acetylornithine deacetylase/succinyl-diaminopimelate desuccinylase-like protein [Haloactinopolyspora alba]|uniref:Acetylornithine deacetylase/succinyl-diaminopimelate desuccinylase-like protein n=1 Tax=Haloactinopolyspora alba TaxID=648780 RepID=A0A2P8DNA1_9ACTN|nr:M20/M25/M40 family metallo-hydrolase [Haloactinopolyspora alba]PSK98706.1 acetylornithine deacetylase/succinyl-diaminopimelate desuccinylase-like protein [Haloactinopolyspora alba]
MSEPTSTPSSSPAPDAEVVDLCRDLLRIDTSNFGDGSGPGERQAAEYVAEQLAEVGLETTVFESEPGRTSVVTRIEGTDPTRTDALLMHGHLDVVPADAADWTHDPFSGELADGCLWGRGAVDMKDMDAMILSVVRDRIRTGRLPARPLILAFLADEEAGGLLGAHWGVDHHPDLFAGATEAVSEVGGFSLTVRDDRRLYLIETAQKGIDWMRLTVDGRAGHGSMVSSENAVTELAEAVARLGRHEWPVRLTPTVQAFLDAVGEEFGVTLDPEDPEQMLKTLGNVGRIVGATMRNTTNPTMLKAGYKHNVIPGRAEAYVDGRYLPGHEHEFAATLDEILGPNVKRESLVHDIAVQTEFGGSLVDAMSTALLAEDPGARTVPYCLSGGTDAKSFSTLGIRNFGFVPLRLPPDLDFAGMFHGVDERVPVDSLRFGARVLDRFIDLA